MTPPRRRVSCAGAVLLTTVLAACQDDDPGTDKDGGGDSSAPTSEASCVSATVGDASLQLSVPPGFLDVSEDSLLDQVWGRPPAVEGDTPDRVALDGFDRDSPDHYVIQQAMGAAPALPDIGDPGFERAEDRVERKKLGEVTWTAPNVNGNSRHRGFVTLKRVGGERFTVTIVASTTNFPKLRSQVLQSVEPGECTQ